MRNISRIGNKTTNSLSATTASSSSATLACAACKYHRRKCTPDCLLAPYFPHDRLGQFLNAHKLFGVSNINKIIKRLGSLEKDKAMKTIMFQADVRAVDPVWGCLGIVLELQRQIEYHKRELDLVLHQLALCRAQAVATGHQNFDIQNPQLHVETTNNLGPRQELRDDHPHELIENTNGSALDVYDPLSTQQEIHHGINHHHQKGQHQDHHHHHHQVSSWTMPIFQESSVTSSSSSFQANNNNDHNYNKQPNNAGGDHNGDQYSANPEMNPSFIDVNDIKFEIEELVERRFVPSTELVMSS